MVAGGLALWANGQRTRAEDEKAHAEAAEKEALRQASIGLAAQSELELTNGLPERFVLLALEALEEYPYTWQAEKALFAAVTENRLVHVFEGHTDIVDSPKWSPDGSRLLTPSRDGTAIIWDVESGEQSLALRGHSAAIYNGSWSPDGTQVATVGWDGKVIVWDAYTGTAVFTLSLGGRVNSVNWSPDGVHIAATSESNTTRIWDAQTGQELFVLRSSGALLPVIWSSNGKYLATGNNLGSLWLWDMSDRALFTFSGHNSSIADWSPDGRYILRAEKDGPIVLTDSETGETITTLPASRNRYTEASLSPDGSVIATMEDDGTFRLWEVSSGQERFSIKVEARQGERLFWSTPLVFGWSPDGSQINFFMFADPSPAIGWGKIYILDVNTGQIIHTLGDSQRGANAGAVWSPDGTQLAASPVTATTSTTMYP